MTNLTDLLNAALELIDKASEEEMSEKLNNKVDKVSALIDEILAELED